MQLETLSDWIEFFTSEDKIHDAGEWSVVAHSYDDHDSTLMFENYSHRTPSPENPTKIKQFIIANDRNKNQLFSNMLFLADHEFSLKKIIDGLEHVELSEAGAALVGEVNGTRLALMTFSVEK
ncbi:MAG: hypothetical protein RL748_3491 [Pseudomonadota bacterium]|jgi:hypothetical protein